MNVSVNREFLPSHSTRLPYIPGRFAGRTVIVTGAGTGMGRATAVRLASEGARVVVTDIVDQRLKQLVADYPDLDMVHVGADLAEPEVIDDIVGAAEGRVDAVANAAGVMDGYLPPAEVDDATWDRVFAVNLTAVMRLTRAVLPLMLDAGRGSFVNVSAEAGLRASASGVAYTSSKHAINGFTKSVAFFYKSRGIRANAVAPGPMATSVDPPFRSAYAAGMVTPLMASTQPPTATSDELAAVITWLLSDEACNVNGVVLPSDGGWSAI